MDIKDEIKEIVDNLPEERLEELQALSQDPFDLIIAGCEMLGWAIALPSNQGYDSEVDIILLGKLDKVAKAADNSDMDWDVMAGPNTIQSDEDVQ